MKRRNSEAGPDLPLNPAPCPLSKREVDALLNALQSYHYPPCVWNGNEVINLRNTANVERYIVGALASDEPSEIKNGLMSVVCWGWGEKANRASKIAQAEKGITDEHLKSFIAYRNGFPDGDIYALACLKLSQLGRMAFGTKVVAFMNPSRRAVLDRKICHVLRDTRIWKRMDGWKDCASIAISARRATIYDAWCAICCAGAACLGSRYRAVDFERAIFMMSENERARAAAIIDRLNF